jgi:hypothetical protein
MFAPAQALRLTKGGWLPGMLGGFGAGIAIMKIARDLRLKCHEVDTGAGVTLQ